MSPAPYPRSDPARTVASRVNRGAPRGAGRALGLSTVRRGVEDQGEEPIGEFLGGAIYRTNDTDTIGSGITDSWWLWNTEADAMVDRYSLFGQTFDATAQTAGFVDVGASDQGPLLCLPEPGVYTATFYAGCTLPASGSMQFQVVTDAMDFDPGVCIVTAGPAGSYTGVITFPPWLNDPDVAGNTFQCFFKTTGVGAVAEMMYAAVTRLA